MSHLEVLLPLQRLAIDMLCNLLCHFLVGSILFKSLSYVPLESIVIRVHLLSLISTLLHGMLYVVSPILFVLLNTNCKLPV
jgi:hypothetical protein